MSITSKPKDFSTLFLDMNSFFASVEQQVQPSLRGLPIGVAPYTGNTGCIISASKEAKTFGIKISRVGEAKKICPKIKILEARPALYMIYHKEIGKVIESFTPYFEPLSIDEFAIKLTAQDQNRSSAIRLALNLKQKIKEEVGDYLTCSVGIGPSAFLAKMAGERHKPDGLTAVTLNELEGFYSGLKLTDLTGINWRMERRLKNLGILSPLSLYKMPMGEMVHILKHWGRLWHFRLRGYEVDDRVISASRRTKTIGHSHVLSPELRTREGALSILRRLISKSGYRLRKEGYWAGGVSVSIQFVGKEGFHQSKKFLPFCDNSSFLKNVFLLLKSCSWQSRPLLVAVAATDLLQQPGAQISIFGDIEKQRAVSEALDKVNDEFGADTLYMASASKSKNYAPDRIPFGRPRYDIRH